MPPAIHMEGLTKTYSGVDVLADLDLKVAAGETVNTGAVAPSGPSFSHCGHGPFLALIQARWWLTRWWAEWPQRLGRAKPSALRGRSGAVPPRLGQLNRFVARRLSQPMLVGGN